MDLGEISLHTESFIGKPEISNRKSPLEAGDVEILKTTWGNDSIKVTVGSLLGMNSKQCKTGMGSFIGTLLPDAFFLAGRKSQQMFSQMFLCKFI